MYGSNVPVLMMFSKAICGWGLKHLHGFWLIDLPLGSEILAEWLRFSLTYFLPL